VKHGALIDSELLADVYVELTGGRQIGFSGFEMQLLHAPEPAARVARAAREFAVPPDELLAHMAFVDAMADPLWRKLDRL